MSLSSTNRSDCDTDVWVKKEQNYRTITLMEMPVNGNDLGKKNRQYNLMGCTYIWFETLTQ